MESYLAERSKRVAIQDLDRGFDRSREAILFPLVLKTVFVVASYLKGRRSSFAIVVERCGKVLAGCCFLFSV